MFEEIFIIQFPWLCLHFLTSHFQSFETVLKQVRHFNWLCSVTSKCVIVVWANNWTKMINCWLQVIVLLVMLSPRIPLLCFKPK